MSDPIDDFIALPRDQQLATLQQLSPDKQDRLLAEVKTRRQKSNTPPQIKTSPEARTAGNYASEIARGVGRGLKNDVTGAFQTIMHPLNTATGISDQATDAADKAAKEFEQTKAAPLGQRLAAGGLTFLENAPLIGGMVQHAEQGGTQIASPEAAGAAAEGITTFAAPDLAAKGIKALPAVLRRGTEIITKTGPRETKTLVENTKAANEAATAKAAEQNAAQDAKRSADVKKHFDKTQAVKADNAAKEGTVNRKEALNRGVEHLDPEIKTELEATEEKVNQEANRRYTELRGKLGDKEALPYQLRDEEGNPQGDKTDLLAHLLEEAGQKIEGSNTQPPIFKDMEKRFNTNDPLTYSDLQGYRSELGRELRKGTLPGDVFAAYKGMFNTITNAMQDIAEANGMADEFKGARDYYRNYAQTFIDRNSPVRKALDAKERGQTVKSFQGKDQSGVDRVAQYNPELAKKINTVRDYQAEAKGILKPTAAAKPPKLGPKPEPVKPEPKTLGIEDVKANKADKVLKGAQSLRDYGLRRALYVAGASVPAAILSFALGHPEGAAAEIATAPGVLAISHVAASVLERPGVVEWLSRPTPKDLAILEKLPADQRSALTQNLSPLIDAARKKGIRVSPALIGLAGTAATLPPNHPVMRSMPAHPTG